MRDASLWRDAIPGYYDDDRAEGPVTWAPRRTYVTSAQHHPSSNRARVSHIVSQRLDYLPDGWRAACSKVIRGTESPTPVLRVCPRCLQAVGE